jgi:excisionase family DNA binding protein
MSAGHLAPGGLLTIKQACDFLKVSRSTFWKLRAEHGLPVVRAGGIVRVRERDLTAWIEKHVEGNDHAN